MKQNGLLQLLKRALVQWINCAGKKKQPADINIKPRKPLKNALHLTKPHIAITVTLQGQLANNALDMLNLRTHRHYGITGKYTTIKGVEYKKDNLMKEKTTIRVFQWAVLVMLSMLTIKVVGFWEYCLAIGIVWVIVASIGDMAEVNKWGK